LNPVRRPLFRADLQGSDLSLATCRTRYPRRQNLFSCPRLRHSLLEPADKIILLKAWNLQLVLKLLCPAHRPACCKAHRYCFECETSVVSAVSLFESVLRAHSAIPLPRPEPTSTNAAPQSIVYAIQLQFNSPTSGRSITKVSIPVPVINAHTEIRWVATVPAACLPRYRARRRPRTDILRSVLSQLVSSE
jgi:hypothetical protein